MKPYWLWTDQETRMDMEESGQISIDRDELEFVEPEGVTA